MLKVNKSSLMLITKIIALLLAVGAIVWVLTDAVSFAMTASVALCIFIGACGLAAIALFVWSVVTVVKTAFQLRKLQTNKEKRILKKRSYWGLAWALMFGLPAGVYGFAQLFIDLLEFSVESTVNPLPVVVACGIICIGLGIIDSANKPKA